MWFKNIQAFQIDGIDDLETNDLEARCADLPSTDCGKFEPFTLGFAPVLGPDSENFTHVCQDFVMLAIRKHEKVLPPAVIRETLQDKVHEIQKTQDRRVGAKEKSAMREEIAFSLLPKAFTKSATTYAYLDRKSQWLFLDSPSAAVAKEFITFLMKVMPGARIVPFEAQCNLMSRMTDWVMNESPMHIALGESAELIDPRNISRVIRLANCDLGKKEILAHLKKGMQVKQVALNWSDRIQFNLTNTFVIKGLRFDDELVETVKEMGAGDPATVFDADFSIMTGELRSMMMELIDFMDGLVPVNAATPIFSDEEE